MSSPALDRDLFIVQACTDSRRAGLHAALDDVRVANIGLHALIWGMATNPNTSCPPLRSIARSVGPVLLVVLVLAACSGTDGGSKSTHSTGARTSAAPARPTTTVAATSTTASAEAALRAAVRSFWDLYLQLGARTGTFDPQATRTRLAERTTGAELTRLFEFFQGNALAGYVVRGGIEVAPTVVSVDARTAQVRDCYDDTTGLYRVSNGERVDTENPNRHQVLMTFVREERVWKVSAIKDEADRCTV